MPYLAQAFVRIRPDATGFRQSTQAQVSAATAGISPKIKVGADTLAAMSDVAALKLRLSALSKQIYDAAVGLQGDKAATLSLARIALQLDKLNRTVSKPTITVEGLAKAEVGLLSLDAAYDRIAASAKAAGDAAKASAARTTAAWTAGGLLGRFSLFGGVATVGGIHLLIDGIIEFAAVVIPAAIAVGAFGLAAAGTISDIATQLKNVNTVSTATGRAIAPLSGAFQKVQDAVKPQVYQLYGDALTIINTRSGAFGKLAFGTGQVLDQLGARFTNAVTHGTGLAVFMKNAIPDVRGLGNILGNLGGALGNIVKVMPGYAQGFLAVAGGISRVLEVATSVLGPVLGFGLAMHGVWLYGGLLVTGLLALQAPMKALALSIITGPVRALQSYIGTIIAADGASASLAAAFAPLLANPFVWIGVAVVALGALAYWLVTSKSATQQWLTSLQQVTQAAPTVSASIAAVASAQAQVSGKLAAAQAKLATMTEYGTKATGNSVVAAIQAQRAYFQQQKAVASLTGAQSGYSSAAVLSNTRLGKLAKTYGSTSAALGLLNAAGITGQQWQDKSAGAWEAIKTQVASTALAYKDMGQLGGTLGADMFVLTQQASDQYIAMQKLNGAWDTFIGLITSFEGNSATAITAFRTLRTDARAAGATFTGVNKVSLTLQNDFNTGLAPAVQQVIDGMRNAKAPTKALATVVATYLNPAVKTGALLNLGMRTAIYDMAREAGYDGPNKIGALTTWFNRNATSVQKAANQVSTYAQNLGKIPATEHSAITVTGGGSWNVTGPSPGGIHLRAAGGMRVPGYGGGDRWPVLVEGGETIVPKHLTPAVAPLMKAHNVPGFARGGVVGKYGPGSVAGLSPWVKGEYGQTVHAIQSATAAATLAGIKSAISAASTAAFKGRYGSGVAQWRPDVLRALAMLGLPSTDAGLVLYQMQTESGGNANAINLTDSNAAAGDPSRGLMQTIMSTFQMWRSFSLPDNIYDPLANIFAAINYAMHNGRGIGTGPGQLGSGHGYARGGVITEPILGIGRSGQRYSFGERGPETVTPGAGGDMATVDTGLEGRLDRLARILERMPAATAAHLEAALSGAARTGARAAFYGV